MKRKWSLRLGAAVLCAVLLGSCSSTAAAPAESTAPADPLTGQQLLYPEQRAAAVVIENTTDSTTQWGIGSASVVLEAMTESGSSTELCLVYPALSAMPVVGPVTRGQDLYWRLLSGQQVLPIQCGSSAYAKRYLEYYNLRAVDAQEVGRNAFVSTGYSWDNTPLWRTSGKAVAAVLDSLSISTAVNQSASGSESETAGVLMIGSKRRVRGLLDMLVEEGYDKENIERICTPIGLKIGAVTPEEIAVSILSEIIAYKRLPEKNTGHSRYVNGSDLDLEMIEYLAENHEPKAVVTVIQAKGSTPRGAGAKMAVDPRGQVTGSIGGGCSEGAVIRDAVDIIGTGEYKTVFIDMTGEVAESDGMVCGGVMYALIEDGTEM